MLGVRSHAVKSIWKCRPPGGGHFGVGFINQALLAKVSLLHVVDKVSFCGRVKPQSRPGNPTDKMKKMSIMANPIMSGGSLVFLTTAHNRAMSSHVQNRLSTDTCETHRYERMGTWFKLPESILIKYMNMNMHYDFALINMYTRHK